MKGQFDIKELIKTGEILNELDYERAMIADRRLRILSKENEEFKSIRKTLRNLIEKYEEENWSTDSNICEQEFKEIELAEFIAEKERIFINSRKELIRNKLKSFNLTQQDFGKILRHNNKSYISELVNGVRPFSLIDLIIINRIFKIKFTDLIPPFLSDSERINVKEAISKLNNPKLNEIRLNKEDLTMV